MIFYPWKMYGEYEDKSDYIVYGENEEECMMKLIELMEKHGKLIYYTGVSDEDYVAGEYIGRDNFIYE